MPNDAKQNSSDQQFRPLKLHYWGFTKFYLIVVYTCYSFIPRLPKQIELIHVNTHARANFALPFGFPSDRFVDYIYKFAKYKGFLITIFWKPLWRHLLAASEG